MSILMRDEMQRFVCPVCAHGGANSKTRTPLCDKCNYKVYMKPAINDTICTKSIILIKVYVTRKSLIPLSKIAKKHGGTAYLIGAYVQSNEVVKGFIKYESDQTEISILEPIRDQIIADMEEHTFVVIKSTIEYY